MAKNLSNLRAPKKANTGRKRVGRGMGSGMGKTSTRGHKGQGSRTGTSLMRGFEGGQMPLHRRLPKRGFTNIFRTEYTVVNLDRIAEHVKVWQVTEIGLDDYKKLGLASSKKALIKILGSGELTAAITIHAHKFSKSAVEKIEKAGGKAVVLGGLRRRGGVIPRYSHPCDLKIERTGAPERSLSKTQVALNYAQGRLSAALARNDKGVFDGFY
jgi:large subunit ribosomal protein L15